MTVSEMTNGKVQEIADRCFAKHPDMGVDGAMDWAKTQPVVVTLNLIAPDGNAITCEIINGMATMTIDASNGSSRRTIKWADVEARTLAACKLVKMF
jgi:hypothetical protein